MVARGLSSLHCICSIHSNWSRLIKTVDDWFLQCIWCQFSQIVVDYEPLKEIGCLSFTDITVCLKTCDIYCAWCRCWSLVMCLQEYLPEAEMCPGCDRRSTSDLLISFGSITALLLQLYLAMSTLTVFVLSMITVSLHLKMICHTYCLLICAIFQWTCEPSEPASCFSMFAVHDDDRLYHCTAYV